MHNRHAVTLATLPSKIDIPGEVVDVSFTERTLRTILVDLIPVIINDEQD